MGYGDYITPTGPRLSRRVDLKIAGGVRLGPSNQVGAWLAQGLSKHLAKDSTFTMMAGGGRGGRGKAPYDPRLTCFESPPTLEASVTTA